MRNDTRRPVKDLIMQALTRSSLPLDSQQLEDRTGISKASISAQLSKMKAAGIIEEAGKDGNSILWRIRK